MGSQTIILKGKKENLVIDPEKESGSRIIIYTDPKKDIYGLASDKVIIKGPGEYEIGGVEILGVKGAYAISIDGVKVGILANTGEELNDKKKEKIGEVDVLICPVDGDNKITKVLAKEWGANYIVPRNYRTEDGALKKFLDDFDNEGAEEIDSIKVDRESLPEGTEVVLLKSMNN